MISWKTAKSWAEYKKLSLYHLILCSSKKKNNLFVALKYILISIASFFHIIKKF